jgi:hypothetical protein
MKRNLIPGDYVLATKYSDGDPKDHFCVGLFRGMLFERYLVEDNKGHLFRANGFRRCEKITRCIGDVLVAGMPIIEQGCASVWYWKRHLKALKELIKIKNSREN